MIQNTSYSSHHVNSLRGCTDTAVLLLTLKTFLPEYEQAQRGTAVQCLSGKRHHKQDVCALCHLEKSSGNRMKVYCHWGPVGSWSSFLYWNFIFLNSCKASLVRFSAGINFSLGAWTVLSTGPATTALQALLQCTQIILNSAFSAEPKSRLSSVYFSFFSPSI